MAASNRVSLCFTPAEDVTDLDEWFASLDRAVSLGREGDWQADARSVHLEVTVDHADDVVREARRALGDAVIVESGSEPLVVDAEGSPIDK